jgi:hypothetical protein
VISDPATLSPTKIVVDGSVPTVTTEAPAVSPPSSSRVCGGMTPEQRRDALFNIVKGISSNDKLLDIDTPQYTAFDWVVNEDPAQVCPDDVIDVEQRYILSLLYFSTNGDNWLACNQPDAPILSPCGSSRYLSSDDECSWMGKASLNCDANGRIRLLAAGTFSVGTVTSCRRIVKFLNFL